VDDYDTPMRTLIIISMLMLLLVSVVAAHHIEVRKGPKESFPGVAIGDAVSLWQNAQSDRFFGTNHQGAIHYNTSTSVALVNSSRSNSSNPVGK